jgi:hypothetical protein
MNAPARHNHLFHGLKKPEIAYLPTACTETLPFPPPTVLSCCRPDMGWQSWRFEGQPCESPHISVYNHHFVMARLDPAIHVFGGAIPGSRSAFASLVRGYRSRVSLRSPGISPK